MSVAVGERARLRGPWRERLTSKAALAVPPRSLPPTRFSGWLYLSVFGIEGVFTVNRRFHGAEQEPPF